MNKPVTRNKFKGCRELIDEKEKKKQKNIETMHDLTGDINLFHP